MKLNKFNRYIISFIILLLIGGLTACEKLPDPAPPGSTIAKTVTPESIGLSSDALAQLTVNIEREFPRIRSVLLIKDHSLVYEWHREGVNPDEIVLVHSGNKIVLAFLAGIAIEEGYFQDEYTTIKSVCPDSYLDDGQVNTQILQTDIDTLLKMESGIRFANMRSSLKVVMRRIKSDSNVIYNVIRLPIDKSNKGKFVYSTESYQTVSAMIMETTEMTDYEYAIIKLFQPLGISPIAFTPDYERMGNVGRDLFLRPVDFAKIGMLLLNGGVYEDQQVVPAEWVKKCMTAQTRGKGEEYPDQGEIDFGYGLWLDEYKDIKVVFAYGKNGQYLIVLPELGLLLTVTSDEKEHRVFYREKLLDWLIAAIVY